MRIAEALKSGRMCGCAPMGGNSILDAAADSSPLEVAYGESFGSEDIKLLEVDESILQEVFDHGVVIRGNLNDEAVLCTASSTFAIKFVMTSNTVLVMPPLNHLCAMDSKHDSDHPIRESNGHLIKARALAEATGHLELVEVVPSIEQLKRLLSQRPYEENEADAMDVEEDVSGLYTWEDLLDNVQASEKELLEGLQALRAVQIGKYWRVVDEKVMQCLLELILLNAVQHDWSLRALKGSDVVAVLNNDGYSCQIVRHCLSTFGRLVSSPVELSTSTSLDEDIWELDEGHVCMHYAKQLLSAASRWRLDDFLDAWQQNLPSGMQCSIDMLKGEVIVEKLGTESWLRPFSVSSLSTNPAERFTELFRERPKWEWQDLEPYVRDLKAPGKSVEALLLKYTRKTQPTADASPVFTAR